MPAALSPAAAGAAGGRGRRWSWLDLTVAGAIAASVAVLLVPAVLQSHFTSQQLACQDNLQHVGTALADYTSHSGGYYPVVSSDGSLDAAGQWAHTLVNQENLPNRYLICPSAQLPENASVETLTPERLQALQQEQLEKLAGRSCSYGLTLGHTDANGKYVPQKDTQRKDFRAPPTRLATAPQTAPTITAK